MKKIIFLIFLLFFLKNSISLAQQCQVDLQVIDATCNGTNGAVTASVLGGAQDYTFGWSNGASAQNISQLATGNYCLTVTHGSGCSAVACATVGNNDLNCDTTTHCVVEIDSIPNCDTTYLVASCVGCTSYIWSNGATTPTTKVTATGTYIVTVTNATVGCTATDTIVIDLIRHPLDTVRVSKDTCDLFFVSSLDGTETTSILEGINGYCDTTIATTWHWMPAFRDTITIDTCVAGIATKIDTLSISGCDGLLTTQWQLLPLDTSFLDTIFTCDTTKLGRVATTFVTSEGCDSVVVTETVMDPNCAPPVQEQQCDVIITHIDGPNPIGIWIDPAKAPTDEIFYILWSPENDVYRRKRGTLHSGEQVIEVENLEDGLYWLQIYTEKSILRAKLSDGSLGAPTRCIRI